MSACWFVLASGVPKEKGPSFLQKRSKKPLSGCRGSYEPRVVGVHSELSLAFDAAPGLLLPVLVNLGVWPDLAALVERCERFATDAEGDALIVIVLTGAADAGTLGWQVAAAGAWAFTRHAALAWAPRGIRLNLIGFGVGPPPESDPVIGGRSAAKITAEPASPKDVVRTVKAIAGWPSMTGQIIRLGGP